LGEATNRLASGLPEEKDAVMSQAEALYARARRRRTASSPD
jgi:hypothetical protein